jgi:serpin B
MRAMPVFLATLLLAGCLSNGPSGPSSTIPTLTPAPTAPAGTGPATTTPTAPTPPVSHVPPSLPTSGADFSRNLFARVATHHPTDNVVLSPFSAWVALAMATAGARGATRDALLSTLDLVGWDQGSLDSSFRELLANESRALPNVTLSTADSLWIDSTFSPSVNERYPKTVLDAYRGDVFTRDFRSPSTVDDINAWAAARTSGEIQRVIDQPPSGLALLLMNAVYFRGDWASPFDANGTTPANFTRADGTVVQAPMMTCAPCGQAYHAGRNGFDVARLPYQDDQLAMYVLLPNGSTPLDHLISSWSPEDLDAATRGGPVEVKLPRFNLSTSAVLTSDVEAMGASLAFGDMADLSGIAPGLKVSSVAQSALMRVNETGTVAAAVTTVGVKEDCVCPPPEPYHFVADHPFVVVLRDDATGVVLFVGLVRDPTLLS